MPDDGPRRPDEYVDWQPRSLVDRSCVLFYELGVAFGQIALLLAGGLFLLLQIGLIGFGLIFNPAVALFTGLSVIPAFLDALYVWTTDEVTTKEPWTLVVVTFFLAAVLASIPIAVNTAVLPLFSSTLGMAVFFFLVVGPLEETAKLLAVRFGAYRADRFDAVIDGTVYGAFAGLGFATIENAIYLAGTSSFVTPGGGPTFAGAATRAGMAPGHVLFSAIAGYYLGLAKFNPEYRGPLIFKGLLIAGLLHGALNTAIWTIGPDDMVGAVAGITDVVMQEGVATGMELLEPWRLALLVAILGIYAIAAGLLFHKIRSYNAAMRRVSE